MHPEMWTQLRQALYDARAVGTLTALEKRLQKKEKKPGGLSARPYTQNDN
jgi:hypothetical protein